jgi:hypothetical protein
MLFLLTVIDCADVSYSFQCPNVLHYVLTVAHSVAVGHHYYATSSVQDSVHQIVHSLVRRSLITNDMHIEVRVLLRRMLTTWVDWYVQGHWESGTLCFIISWISLSPSLGHPRSPHIVDVTSAEGLLDMISLGCLIEFSNPLDQRLYLNEAIPHDEQEEIEAAMTRYRRFITWYQERFFVVIENEWINPSYLFSRRMVDFAATLVRYVTEQEKDFHLGALTPHTLTQGSITRHLLNHFREGWSELTETFLEVKKYPSPHLYYDGPTIRIEARPKDWKRRFDSLFIVEMNESSFAPLQVQALKKLAERPPSASASSSGDTSSGEEEMDVEQEEQVEVVATDMVGTDMDEDDDEEDSSQDGGEVGEASTSSSSSSSGVAAPAPSTPPPLKRNAATPSHSPSSSRPAKRPR